MFLSVTPNPALDHLLFIDAWTPGVPTQARAQVRSVGGKGLDASVALRHLGQPTVGLHFAAGATGRALLDRVAEYGITPEPIWVAGETRMAFIIAETRAHQHTHIFSGNLVIRAEHVQAFLARYQEKLSYADWVLTGGMLPPDLPPTFFRTLVEMATAAQVPILVDAARAPLVECLVAHPRIVKMNRDEFGWTFGANPGNLKELTHTARAIFRQHKIRALILTCGADGILGFTPEGMWRAIAPPQIVVNAAGAGDVASATLAWRIRVGDRWDEVLRWTAATSAASVLTEGTADLRMEDVRRILPLVEIENLNREGDS